MFEQKAYQQYLRIGILFMLVIVLFDSVVLAEDWPTWRHDASRTAASSQQLAEDLHLQWVRTYSPLEPAWEDVVNQDRMPFDRQYEPVVAGQTMFIASNRSDRVVALNTRTGQERWRVYVDGPVRFPPVVGEGRLFFTSDDGYLYCVDANEGKILWKFRGGPSDRKILGNSRLISSWPARGGPVIQDGTVYFAASIWPFMGVFLHAIDAETGTVVWTNDAVGSTYMDQPHTGSTAFGGAAPQGAIAVIGNRLLVPCGRSVPACFDRKTGKEIYYHLSGTTVKDAKSTLDRKREGGSHVSAVGKYFFNHRGINTSMYDVETGDAYMMWEQTTYPVLTSETLYLSGNPVTSHSFARLKKTTSSVKMKDKNTVVAKWLLPQIASIKVDGTGALIKAGDRLYAGGEGVVSAIDIAFNGSLKISWSAQIEGSVARIIAADDRLFVVTLQGAVYAFGENECTVRTFATRTTPLKQKPLSLAARTFVEDSKDKHGYCLVYGPDAGSLAKCLLVESALCIVAIMPDADKVIKLRRQIDATGLYGPRLTVLQGDPARMQFPQYLAEVTFYQQSEGQANPETLEKIYDSTRPYGGVVYLDTASDTDRDALMAMLERANLPGAKIDTKENVVLLKREGALPGSVDWTHLNADIGNSMKSDDQLVKLPMGILWFGGNRHDDILPRHSHGPTELVVDGRLFIEGMKSLSARDVYTGMALWKREFENLGTAGVYFDESYQPDPLDTTYNQKHIPGANSRGSNYVATSDSIYLIIGFECLVLDPVTGRTQKALTLPRATDEKTSPTWAYIGVYEDYLIAGSRFADFSKQYAMKVTSSANFDLTSCQTIVVLNRHSGEVIWSKKAANAFRHNTIIAGNGTLFAIDSVPDPVVAAAKRRGNKVVGKPTVWAIDLATGKKKWSTDKDIFGSWLGYSKEHDVLVQSGRASRDMIAGEPSERMAVYKAVSGAVVWDKKIQHSGPCILHGDTIYTNAASTSGNAVELLTGEMKTRKHPLTGETVPWTYNRFYGCNSVVASEYMLEFRSGAAGFYDLEHDGGTGNFGGFKSGCTSNLIAANGVLNAPDYTRTCTCSYQNQTSLALVHMPEAEYWTFNKIAKEKTAGRIKSLGVNFGAPGDRVADNGTLWIDYPDVGGASPTIELDVEGDDVAYFRRHSSAIEKGPLPWVGASGLMGAAKLSLRLAPKTVDTSAYYTVRLCFSEPKIQAAEKRVFSVTLQDKVVLKDFDISKATGGKTGTVIKAFKGIRVADILRLSLDPQTPSAPVLSGLEVVLEPEK